MSARSPRRQFARPFVVTLALTTASTLLTASSPAPVEPAPVHPPPPAVSKNPPPPAVSKNPPPPAVHKNPPPPVVNKNPPPFGVSKNPPPPVKPDAETAPSEDVEPAREKSRWRVEKGTGHCTSRRIVEPRECAPGARCNPPKPLNYDCPPGLTPPFEVVQAPGTTACFVYSPAPCATCKPLPPHHVPCP